MTSRYVMALDLGTSSLKALIADLKGRCVALSRSDVRYTIPKGLEAMGKELEPERLWDSVREVIARSIKNAGIQPKELASVSTTSQRGGVAFVDVNGREVCLSPIQDARAFFQGAALDERVGLAMYASRGRLPSFLFAPAKLHWFRLQQPETYERISKALSFNAWLSYRLSGEVACDAASLVEMGLLDLDVAGPDPFLLGELDVNPDVLPRRVESGKVVGVVTAQIARDTALPQGIPVVSGGPDTQCGLLGMGLAQEGQIGILAGWSTPLQMATSSPIIDGQKRTWTGRHVISNRWVLESSATDGGLALEWLSKILNEPIEKMLGNCQRSAYDDSFGGLTAAFLGPRIMDCKKLGLYRGGFLFPTPVGWLNVTRGHLIAAALENLAFAIKGNYLQLVEITGVEGPEVWLAGGLAKSPNFPRLVCDTLGMAVNATENREVTLLGTAMAAAVGLGEYKTLTEAAEGMKGSVSSLSPDLGESSILEERYEQWLDLYHKLEKLEEGL